MNKIQEQADLQRSEAKELLKQLFGIKVGESNGKIERVVDCIISAAILEMAAIQEKAARSAK